MSEPAAGDGDLQRCSAADARGQQKDGFCDGMVHLTCQRVWRNLSLAEQERGLEMILVQLRCIVDCGQERLDRVCRLQELATGEQERTAPLALLSCSPPNARGDFSDMNNRKCS